MCMCFLQNLYCQLFFCPLTVKHLFNGVFHFIDYIISQVVQF